MSGAILVLILDGKCDETGRKSIIAQSEVRGTATDMYFKVAVVNITMKHLCFHAL
jgi:hypothetical protein